MKTFQQGISKEELQAKLAEHRKADNFRQGMYWDDGKGCAVGCTIQSFGGEASHHMEYERLFGIPAILGQLEDSIFEGMSVKDSKWWPEAFIDAVPENVDLKMVWPKFCIWMLEDVKQYANDESKKCIDTVIKLYKKITAGKSVSKKQWLAASAAYAASAAASKKQALKLIEILRLEK